MTLDGGRPTDDSLVAYIPKVLRDYWHSLPPEFTAKMGPLYRIHADLVGQINRAGVSIQGGRLLDRSTLDRLLARAKALAAADGN
jgi:hypothetical protein